MEILKNDGIYSISVVISIHVTFLLRIAKSCKNAVLEMPERDDKEGQTSRPTDIISVIKNIGLEDIKTFSRLPCAREAYVFGISTGTGLGLIQFLLRKNLLSASNWAVGTFCLISVISWETCQYKKRDELERLRTVITKYNGREKSSSTKIKMPEKNE